jgi:hypothetical protein
MSLWAWSPLRSRRKMEHPLCSVDALGAALSGLIFLNLAIWGADTWFHVATRSVQAYMFRPSATFTNTSRVPRLTDCEAMAAQYNSDSNGAGSTPWTPSAGDVCYEFNAGRGTAWSPTEGDLTVHGQSSINKMQEMQLTESQYTYLLDPAVAPELDFLASTLGVSTSCRNLWPWAPSSVPSACHADSWAGTDDLNFTCGPGVSFSWLADGEGAAQTFASSMANFTALRSTVLPIGTAWYTDADLTQPYVSEEDMPISYGPPVTDSPMTAIRPDPLLSSTGAYMLVAGSLPWYAGEYSDIEPLWNGTSHYEEGYFFVYSCEVALASMNYSIVNQTTVAVPPGSVAPASTDVYAILLATDQAADHSDEFQDSAGSDIGGAGAIVNMLGELLAINITTINATDQLGGLVETSLRQSVASFLTTVSTTAPSLQEQVRTEVLLARVPRAPLWTLVGLCLVSTAIGVAVTCWAFAHYNAEVRAGRECLTVEGIIESWCGRSGRAFGHGGYGGEAEAEGALRPVRLGVARRGDGSWGYVYLVALDDDGAGAGTAGLS